MVEIICIQYEAWLNRETFSKFLTPRRNFRHNLCHHVHDLGVFICKDHNELLHFTCRKCLKWYTFNQKLKGALLLLVSLEHGYTFTVQVPSLGNIMLDYPNLVLDLKWIVQVGCDIFCSNSGTQVEQSLCPSTLSISWKYSITLT